MTTEGTAAEQGERCGQQHPADDRGVDEDGGGRPDAKIFRSTTDIVANTENTATKISAALVTTPALDAISSVMGPRSRMRERMNT